MGSRRKARELALQFLYQIEINREDPAEALRLFWTEHPAPRETIDYATDLIRGTRSKMAEIDRLLARLTRNWDIGRMAAVDRNLLRLAAYEMLYLRKAPPIVVINEAVEIAKRYSTPDSGAFVNGILDGIRKEREADAGAEG